MAAKQLTVLDVQQAKNEGRRLTMLTAYDYPLGLMAAESGVDIVLEVTRSGWSCESSSTFSSDRCLPSRSRLRYFPKRSLPVITSVPLIGVVARQAGSSFG